MTELKTNQSQSELSIRPRRLRGTKALRQLVQENRFSKEQLIMPYFVKDGAKVKESIDAMPGQYRYSVDQLLLELESLVKSGVHSILLFGLPSEKDDHGSEAASSKGAVQNAVREIKKNYPELLVITDVCLCAYTNHGHCGVISATGEIQNDPSLELIAQTALSHVEAGADMVAPSDMMDGRVKAIRTLLDQSGFQNTPIMSYAAKYASAFYGPFRDAAGSAPAFGDRKTYQMDPANAKEALREMELDVQEGADILMVKPALAYLDIIQQASQTFHLPIAAYAVSGEYAMIKAASERGWVDEKTLVMESLMSLKRAGADILITYHAKSAASWLTSK